MAGISVLTLSRAHSIHYVKKDWLLRKSLKIGEKNVQHSALAKPDKILLPPLHIKLGLMKNLVKAMDQNGSVFKYLSEKFPQSSEAKIKEGIFVGPQIRQLFIDEKFDNLLKGDEKKAWDAFRLVSTNFLGNVRAGNYKELVKDVLSMYDMLKELVKDMLSW
ncbi:hypothetical protein P4O66_019509 [Electrophorus voltai]|uniref:Uncharacterized protein n=1 Tax=Electrophorus voltai TaxID=2609070 RepID=A0AAD9E5H9_9TELE|nr:hypothetical protein P4O66_019509 [Electrophorus voltai]